jgi:hypothetical protein
MLRGGVFHLAAQMFLVLAPAGAFAQAPIRTRDASFAVVRYESGLTAAALTLYDAIALSTERSVRSAYSLVSLFGDGRVSMQGGLEAASRSAAMPVVPQLSGWFTALRGETLLEAVTTIQTGFMPTAALTGKARIHFEHAEQGGYLESSIARAFDGRIWQTVVKGTARLWKRAGAITGVVSTSPMQLGIGDFLSDFEGQLDWDRGHSLLTSSLGIRIGEASRGTTAWGSLTLTVPVFYEAWATASIGSYPADLIQNLPAGRYLSVGLRLPGGRFPRLRPPPLLPPPPPPRTPDLPVTHRLALVVGPSLDSLFIREVKVWAPGARVVEVMADFVDWLPVPLLRQPNGEWKGYYRIPPGLHRVNVRIDGEYLDAPLNWHHVNDEFQGTVALVIVR